MWFNQVLIKGVLMHGTVLFALYCGYGSLLVLLDFSAVFDTMVHDILMGMFAKHDWFRQTSFCLV